jgi:hypothetical protein
MPTRSKNRFPAPDTKELSDAERLETLLQVFHDIFLSLSPEARTAYISSQQRGE